jgi:photosystem II stability/assembly factor-like uncharacterized protein
MGAAHALILRIARRMNVRRILLTLCGFLLTTALVAQDTAWRDHLELTGCARRISIDPTGNLWIGTQHGRLLRSSDRGQSWQLVNCPSQPPGRFGRGADELRLVSFFDRQTGILAGGIGHHDKVLFRTIDGGDSWSPISLPSSFYANDGQTRPDGTGWLVGPSGILLTTDGGMAWTRLPLPKGWGRSLVSLHFINGSEGILQSGNGRVLHTLDAGRSWRPIPAPAGAEHGGGAALRHPIRLVGSRIIVKEPSGVVTRPLHGEGEWIPLEARGDPISIFELHPSGLLAVTQERQIVFLDDDLEEIERHEESLPDLPLDIACSTDFSAFLLRNQEIAILDETGLRSGPPLAAGEGGRSWKIVDLDRTTDGELWAISEHHLYRSPDAGERWCRVAETGRSIRDVYAFSDASGALLSSWSRPLLWDAKTGETSPLPVFEDLLFDGVYRRDDVWIAWGHTFSSAEAWKKYDHLHTVLAGEGIHALVACSVDGGRQWEVIDRFEGAAVNTVHLADDDYLTICFAGGGIRRGILTVDQERIPRFDLANELLPEDGTGPIVGMGQWAFFSTRDEGWSGGSWSHGGDVRYHTTDGGMTWIKIEEDDLPRTRVVRLGDGRWLRFQSPAHFTLWHDGDFRDFPSIPGVDSVSYLTVTAGGDLLVMMREDAVWSLSLESSTWERLW